MAQHDSLEVPIPDRSAAGRALAGMLSAYAGQPDVVVLALPRGGVPVAYEIAMQLGVPLDLMLVRKLGVPGYSELAMGAIASGGVRVLNPDVLLLQRVDSVAIDMVAERETRELQRRDRAYRGERPSPELAGKQVILVDDGLATGATMQAAVEAVRQQHPARVVVAVPIGAPETVDALRAKVDEVVCPLVPERLMAIGRWYLDFSQTSDEQVLALLRQAWQRESEIPRGPGA